MEKRVVLAFALSVIVLVVYQSLFLKPGQKTAGRTGSRPAATAPAGTPGLETPGGAQAPAAPAPTAPAAATSAAPSPEAGPVATVADTEVREVVIDTDEIRAVFSTRGAELKSWRLKTVLDDNKTPVDLVPRGVPPQEPRGFALLADDAALTARMRSALYRPSAEGLTLGRESGRLAFDYADASGLASTLRRRGSKD